MDTGHNLPSTLTSFVGRHDELETVSRLLSETRLLTLTGAGGCGKSRLALQTAFDVLDTYPDGIWWVDLGPLTDDELVPNTVAAALGLQEIPLASFETRLVDALIDQKLLLIVDNCEHLIDRCAQLVVKLLQGCPHVTAMATSREPLGVEGETAWRVPSLMLPEIDADPAAIATSDAVALFIERALKARPNFRVSDENVETISQICRRLDGIPLAIELAAARTRVLNPIQIAAGLDDRFRLLSGGSRTSFARQQTLLASIEWSHALLTEDERVLFRRLTVFSGSFTLDAAEAVCADDHLSPDLVFDTLVGLVDKSLVQVEEREPTTSYRLLESIRQFASQKLLDSDETQVVRDRHLAFFVSVANGRQLALEEGANSTALLKEMDDEYDDFRIAMEWARSSSPEEGMQIARALWNYWWSRGLWREGSKQAEAAASAPGEANPGWRARALSVAAALASTSMDGVRARQLGKEAATLAQASQDEIATTESLYVKALVSLFTEPDVARPLLQEAVDLANRSGSTFWHVRTLLGLGIASASAGELPAARDHLAKAMRMHRSAGNRLLGPWVCYWAAMVAVWAGDLDDVDPLVQEALAGTRELQNIPLECGALVATALAALLRGEPERTARDLDRARRMLERHPDPLVEAGWILYAGLAHYVADDTTPFTAMHRSVAFFDAGDIKWFAAHALAVQSAIARCQGDLREARRLADEAVERGRASGNGHILGLALRTRGHVALEVGDKDRAQDLYHESVQVLTRAGAKPALVDALESVACSYSRDQSWEEAARLFSACERVRSEMGFHRYPVDHPDYEEELENTRAALGSQMSEIWDAGASMRLEEAAAYASRGRGERKRPPSGWRSLTPTEVQIVELVAEGLTNPEIGQRLFIAPGTVKNHLSHVFAKLGLATRTEVAAGAVRRLQPEQADEARRD